MPRGMTERDNYDRSYSDDSASDMSRDGGGSGRYGAGRPHGRDARGYDDSDFGEPRNGASRGHGSHHATRRDDYADFSDDGSLAGDSVSPHSGGTRGHRGTVREDYDSSLVDDLIGTYASHPPGGIRDRRAMRGDSGGESVDDDSFAGRGHRGICVDCDDESFDDVYAGRRSTVAQGQRVQGPPYSRGTGSRYTGNSYTDSPTGYSADDHESDYHSGGVRGGIEASTGHSGPSARRGAIYPGGHAGPGDSSDSEHGGRIPGLRSHGRYGSGRDSDHRRY